jgi:dTMP kinase
MFITFEGIDGSGKSTQARLLVDRLRTTGRQVCLFREPGGTKLAERIRALLLDPELEISPLAELLLFSSARAQLVEEAIRPELKHGAIVVCDRFYDSTTAYQGAGRGALETEWIKAFNCKTTGGLIPDRTYYISITPALAAERRVVRADERGTGGTDNDEGRDRMEMADSSFYQRVVSAYDQLAAAEPHRIVQLDGRLTIDQLHETIWADFQELRLPRDG